MCVGGECVRMLNHAPCSCCSCHGVPRLSFPAHLSLSSFLATANHVYASETRKTHLRQTMLMIMDMRLMVVVAAPLQNRHCVACDDDGSLVRSPAAPASGVFPSTNTPPAPPPPS